MTIFTAAFWWVWIPILFVCLGVMTTVGKSSRWFPVFWMPLAALCLIFISVFFKSCGAGPQDGPSGLVVLFMVFPTMLISFLGFVGFWILWKNRPEEGAWCISATVGGICVCAVALSLTFLNVTRPFELLVVDAHGHPVTDKEVVLTMSDHMSEKSTQASKTDASGVAKFSLWPSKYLEFRISNRGGYDSLTVLGLSGWGIDQKVWKHSWGLSGRSHYYLGATFFDDDPVGKRLTMYIRNKDDLFLESMSERLSQSIKQASSHPLGIHCLSEMGRNCEGFGQCAEFARIAAQNPALGHAAVEALTQQARLLDKIYEERKNAFFTLKINGETTGVIINRLLDAAKPLLGNEDSTANVYWELGRLAQHRLQDLKDAQKFASPRVSQRIQDAITRVEPRPEK
jgi:hypothetical protein